jgi:hypothetical protein
MAAGKKKKVTLEQLAEEEPAKPAKKHEESEDGPPWKHGGSCRDGKRYTVSVLKDPTRKDMTCYKQFYETESLPDAKEEASDKAMDTGLPVMIFDRKDNWVIHQFDPQKAGQEAEEATTSRKKKK